MDAFIPQSIEHPPADLVTMERIADETAKLKAKELLSSSGVKRKFDESDIASDSLIAARDDDEIDI